MPSFRQPYSMRDVATGKTKVDVKTKKHGYAIVDGGPGTATRTVGLLGGILTFAISEGIRNLSPPTRWHRGRVFLNGKSLSAAACYQLRVTQRPYLFQII